MSKDDSIEISTQQLLSNQSITQEQIKSIANLTAKQIYQQGFGDGYKENATNIWNLAIEAVLKLPLDEITYLEIRKLKK